MASRRAAQSKQREARRSQSGWVVYVLRCGDGSLYTGCTNDLARRVAAHAAGRGARYTRSRPPVALVHAEPARDRGAALRREAAIKRLRREEKLALVATSGSSRTGRGLRVRVRPPAARKGRPRAAR